MDTTTAATRNKLVLLSKLLLLSNDVPVAVIDKAQRHLRQTNFSNAKNNLQYLNIRKQKIIKSISESSDEPIQKIALFEKECDNLRRYNSSLLDPILTVIESLSHYPSSNANANATHTSADVNYFPSPVTLNQITDSSSSDGSNSMTMSIVSPLLSTIPSTTSIPQSSSSSSINALIWCNEEVERLLIRDLLYIFQGIDGKHIKYDVRSEYYVIDPSLSLKSSVVDTVLSLCEIGYLFKIVACYIQKSDNITQSKGQVIQAFGYSLQEEFHDYYRLLAVLDQEYQSSTSSSTSTSGLTLVRLKLWMSEPLDRMYLIARLVDAVGPLTGGALASRLHGHTNHGDATVSKTVMRILDNVCNPLYTMLSQWILYGELYDPFHEFFVSMSNKNSSSSVGNSNSNNNSNKNNIVWQDSYHLLTSMIPSFLSSSLAMKILIIGKSINYICACISKLPKATGEMKDNNSTKKGVGVLGLNRQRSNNTNNVASALGYYDDATATATTTAITTTIDSITGATKEMSETLHSLRYGDEYKLIEVVHNISSSTDSKLLSMMNNSFQLNVHLLALKKFMLLGQGDFVTCLMDSVGHELRKRANQLYRHNLTGMLEGALRSSNAQFEPSYVLDRIGIRLTDAAAGDTGWEVFSLDYMVDMPLNAVIHERAMSKYHLLFNMLWRLKRVEWSLSIGWKHLMSFTHTRSIEETLPRLRPVLHRCTLSRGRMLHVVNNLCAFLMFEVMESAWVKLHDKLSKSLSLDDVIIAHDDYLDELLDRALLNNQHIALNMQLQQLLKCILRFCSLEESLISDALVAVSQSRARKKESVSRTNSGKWGDISRVNTVNTSNGRGNSSNSSSNDTTTYDGVPVYLVTRIDEAVHEYNIQFNNFMSLLRDGSVTGEIVRFLTFRLDFNDYHTSSSSSSST